MKIKSDLSAEVPDTNAYHLKLEDHDNGTGDLLFYGYNSSRSAVVTDSFSSFFNNSMPCEFAQKEDHHGYDALKYDRRFNLVYGICPWTVKWLNQTVEGDRYRYGFYPFNKKIIPEQQEKEYDVIYHGGIHGPEHEQCLASISKFKYQFVTMTHHINQRTQKYVPMATRTNLPFLEKVEMVGKCKTSVCYNFVNNEERHFKNISSWADWQKNYAFKEARRFMPQFKTRMHEAAISKTVNLVMRDPWNLAEDYYVPGKEFLYFDTPHELEELIDEVSHNWGDYSDIADAAYERAMNYTTDKFVQLVESCKNWEGLRSEES